MKNIVLILIAMMLFSCITPRKKMTITEVWSTPNTKDYSVYGTIEKTDTVYIKMKSYRRICKMEVKKTIKIAEKRLKKGKK